MAEIKLTLTDTTSVSEIANFLRGWTIRNKSGQGKQEKG